MLHARDDYNRGKMDTIPENEPVFLLRAQDKTAAETVRYWARLQPLGQLRQMALHHPASQHIVYSEGGVKYRNE